MLKEETLRLIKYFRLQRFAAATMWISKEVFLLDEIMQVGNFGHFDNRLGKDRYQSRVGLLFSWMKHIYVY